MIDDIVSSSPAVTCMTPFMCAASLGGGVGGRRSRRAGSSRSRSRWARKAAKGGRLVLPLDEGAAFTPVMVEPPMRRTCPLEVEIAGAVIRVGPGTDLTLLRAVVGALKGVS